MIYEYKGPMVHRMLSNDDVEKRVCFHRPKKGEAYTICGHTYQGRHVPFANRVKCPSCGTVGTIQVVKPTYEMEKYTMVYKNL